MNFWDELGEIHEYIRQIVDQRLAMLFGWTLAGATTALGRDNVKQSDDGGVGQRPAQRLEPWGFRSRPVSGRSRRFWVRLGASNVVDVGGLPDKGYGPSDLAEGEWELYCAQSGARIKMDQNGKIIVTGGNDQNIEVTSTGSGNIILQGGTKGVARLDDEIRIDGGVLGAMQFNLDQRYQLTGGASNLTDLVGSIRVASTKVKSG